MKVYFGFWESRDRFVWAVELKTFQQHVNPVGLRTYVLGLAAWAVGAVIAFRSFFFSSFDLIFGNYGDGRLIVYLHEHWFNALHGRVHLLSPPFFYPQQNVLGYSDAFLLDIPAYVALRSLGFDPYLSCQIWLIVLSLCCFAASLIVFRRYLKLGAGISVCAAALITFPNNVIYKTALAHIHFFSVYYIPCIVLLALWGLEGFPRLRRWSLAKVASAAVLFGLLFSTAYSIAWLFAFTLLIALCIVAIMFHRELLVAARQYFRPGRSVIGAAAFGFAVGIIPLIIIYFPALFTFSGRTFRDYISFAPFPKNVFDVSIWNLLWGWLVERLLGDRHGDIAVTPGMTAIFLVLAYRLRKGDPNDKSWQPRFFVICALVWLLSWLLVTRIGTFSLFWLPFHLIPGGSAVRGGGRIHFLTNMWVVSGLAVVLQYWIDKAVRAGRQRRAVLSGAILGFCLIEQINLLPAHVSRSSEFAWLATVPSPPPECRAFLMSEPRKDFEAMWVSLKTGLPTLNGNSGWSPPHWRLDDRRVDYFDAARQWIAHKGLREQVCVYNQKARTWSPFRQS